MLAEFGYKFENEKSTNWSKDVYDPAIHATGFSGVVGIRKLFDDFKKVSDCKIKFCTFACIRPSATFANDSIETLKFAEAVNSCAGLIVNPATPLPDDSDSAPDMQAATSDNGRLDPVSRPPAGLPSGANLIGSSLTGTGAIVSKGGGSLRKSKRNKNKNSKSTLKSKSKSKSNSKSNPAHKKKSTRKHKHKKNSSISRNKNKSTIKNRN